MSKQRLTEWFEPDVKPTLLGVYEVKSPYGSAGPWYSYFDGREFGYRERSAEMAAKRAKDRTSLPGSATWRGLAEKP